MVKVDELRFGQLVDIDFHPCSPETPSAAFPPADAALMRPAPSGTRSDEPAKLPNWKPADNTRTLATTAANCCRQHPNPCWQQLKACWRRCPRRRAHRAPPAGVAACPPARRPVCPGREPAPGSGGEETAGSLPLPIRSRRPDRPLLCRSRFFFWGGFADKLSTSPPLFGKRVSRPGRFRWRRRYRQCCGSALPGIPDQGERSHRYQAG